MAEVVDSEEEAKNTALFNGEEATLLVVTKKGGTDTLELVSKIDSIFEDYKKTYLNLSLKSMLTK